MAEIPVKLIYHDPTRCFGGLIDDPQARLTYYLETFARELAEAAPALAAQNAPAAEQRLRTQRRAACEPC